MLSRTYVQPNKLETRCAIHSKVLDFTKQRFSLNQEFYFGLSASLSENLLNTGIYGNCRGKKCYQSLYSDLSFTPRVGTGSELPDPGFKKLNKKKVLRKEKIIIFEAENWAEAEEFAA